MKELPIMKKMPIYLLIILMPLVAFASDREGFVFKEGISWGIKQSMLANLEKQAMHQNDYSYFIDTGETQEGLDTTLAYFFTSNDKLAQIVEIYDNYNYKLVPMQNYTNYLHVRNRLIERFGEPYIERTSWLDLNAKNNYNNNDMAALIAGKSEMLAAWNLPDTNILLSMGLNQSRVRITVVYQSKDFADTYFMEDAARQKSGVVKSY